MNPRHIVAIGDSLTNEEPDNWTAHARVRLPGVRLAVEAHGGWSTHSYFRERLAHVAFANVPADAELCVILLGSNNLFEARGGDAAAVLDAVAGVRRIAAHVRTLAPGLRDILLLAPPTVALRHLTPADRALSRRVDQQSPLYLGQLSHAYRELAGRLGWRFADLFPVLTEADYVDPAHPGPDGQRKLADVIVPAIAAWLDDVAAAPH